MVYPNDDKQVINLEHVLPEQVENNWPEFDEDTGRRRTIFWSNQFRGPNEHE